MNQSSQFAFGFVKHMQRFRLATARPALIPVLALLLMTSCYAGLAWLTSGGDIWWHIDVVGNSMIYWGDDAYRWFLARSLMLDADIYWFNFALPVALWLDHLLILLAGDDLFITRSIKAFLAAISIILLWRSGRIMAIQRLPLMIALTLLAVMPLYFFVAMSFYGESWLALLILLAMYTHLKNQLMLAAVVVSFLPLVRPEGIFFVLGYSGWLLSVKHFRLALVPFLVGGVYFLAINIAGPGIIDFVIWRRKVTQIYSAVGGWHGTGWEQFLRVFFLPWLLLSLWGCLRPPMRALTPFFLASILVLMLFYVVAFVLGTASFEARYMVSVLPLLSLGVAAGLDDMIGWLRSVRLPTWLIRATMAIFLILCLQAQTRSILGVERVVADTLQRGALPADVRAEPWSIGTYFHGISTWGLDGYRELADVVTRMVRGNRDIKAVLIGNIQLFYHLDPAQIPADVKVVFVPVPSFKMVPALGGHYAGGYFARQPYADYFRLDLPQPGESQLLYIDRLELSDYPYHWSVAGNDIYLFSLDNVARLSSVNSFDATP